ncbi:MAG: protein kinase [Gemmataceae bacterium]|nr:protein kinase [Gemmataceae bacterium]
MTKMAIEDGDLPDAVYEAQKRFALAWREGGEPAIDDYLGDAQHRHLLLAELIPIDMECRLLRSLPVALDDYQRRYPDHFADAGRAANLVQIWAELDSRRAEATRPMAAFSAGMTVGPFKLRESLGDGGMGVVYVADQLEPVRRRVAVKFIKPGPASSQILARFEQERQALALMDHPNIAKVLDAGTTDTGAPYFVMEYIKGEPITHYCDVARLTPRERLELFIPVCQAVQHAHQKGLIHRDLKPSNILVALYDGKPIAKVIDFGVAKATGSKLTDQTVYTEAGKVLGTPEYMAPEQAELTNLDIDTRADIYALGIVLYELMTGSVPFGRTPRQPVDLLGLLRMIKDVEPTKPSTKVSTLEVDSEAAKARRTDPKKLAGQLRGDLDWIILKCLEKERSRRYESATDLAADIERHLRNEPVLAGPPSAAYRVRKFVGRYYRPLAVAGLALSVMGVLATVSWNQVLQSRRRAEDALAVAKAANAETAEQRNKEKEASRQLREVLSYSTFRLAHHPSEMVDQNGARSALLTIPAEHRDWAWWHFYNSLRGGYAELLGHSDQLQALAFSPDGKWLASASFDSSVRIWNALTGVEHLTLPVRVGRVFALRFDPNSRSLIIAYSRPDDSPQFLWSKYPENPSCLLSRWDIATGQLQVTDGVDGNLNGVSFNHDGTEFVSAVSKTTDFRSSEDGRSYSFRSIHDVRVFSSTTLKQLRAFPGRLAATFSPDGSLIAAFSNDECKHIRLIDSKSGAIRVELPWEKYHRSTDSGYDPACPGLEFTPDGKYLAASGKGFVLWDYRSATEKLVRRDWFNGRICPDGSHVVVDHRGGFVFASLNADQEIPLRGAGPLIALSPEGTRIATAGSYCSIALHDLRSPVQLPNFTYRASGNENVGRPIVNPATNTLAFLDSVNAQFCVCDFGSGDLIKSLPQTERNLGSGSINRFGTVLAFSDMTSTHVWNCKTGAKLATLSVGTYDALLEMHAISLSDDGNLVAITAGKAVVIHDMTTGMSRRYEVASPATFVTLSPDGVHFASGHIDGSVIFWDRIAGKPLWSTRSSNAITAIAFSQDGSQIISGTFGGAVLVWSVDGGREIARLRSEGANSVWAVAIGKDGRTAVAGGEDKVISIWSLPSGKIKTSLEGHAKPIRFVGFTEDDAKLISADDCTVITWDAANTTLPLAVLHGHTDHVRDVAFSPDGRWLASLGGDQKARLWGCVEWECVHQIPSVLCNEVACAVGQVRFDSKGEVLRIFAGSDVDCLLRNHFTTRPAESKLVWQQDRHRHPTKEWVAVPHGRDIHIFRPKTSDRDLATVRAKNRIDVQWHRREAQTSAKANSPYAVAFHLSWVATALPSETRVWDELEEACKRLGSWSPMLLACDRVLAANPTFQAIVERRDDFRKREAPSKSIPADGKSDLINTPPSLDHSPDS